jgi:hypothetical protein
MLLVSSSYIGLWHATYIVLHFFTAPCYSYLRSFLVLYHATRSLLSVLLFLFSLFSFLVPRFSCLRSFIYLFFLPCYLYFFRFLYLATTVFFPFISCEILLASPFRPFSVPCYSRVFPFPFCATLLACLCFLFLCHATRTSFLSLSVPCYSSIQYFLFLGHFIPTVLSTVLFLVPVYHLTCRSLGPCDAFWGDSMKPRYRTRPILFTRCIFL